MKLLTAFVAVSLAASALVFALAFWRNHQLKALDEWKIPDDYPELMPL